jgi:hypothetical protein
MFQFPSYAPQGYFTHLEVLRRYSQGVSPFGHIRINACLAAPRTLSWPTPSFIASMSQGIHLVP